MNLVDWNAAMHIVRKKPQRRNTRPSDRLWSEIVNPANYEELVGNEEAIRSIADWFGQAALNLHASSCLFVHGESGTGKSTAVSIIAKKFNFEAVTTYADQSRTPARLEGVVREAGVHGSRGVIVLEDFEIFLSETTSLRVLSKLLRQLLSSSGDTNRMGLRSRCLFIIISNAKHKLFGSLQDISTIVRFERLQQREIYKIYNRLATRVRDHSYVPPMASYLSSISSSGTITQGVQQLQLLYGGDSAMDKMNVDRPRSMRNRKKRKMVTDSNMSLGSGNKSDCISYLWSDIYTHKILELLVDDRFQRGRVLDRLIGFERGRLDAVGCQLHDEYARRMTSMTQLRSVAECISMSDINRMEVHQDALYDGENSEAWSANEICYVSFMARAVAAIKGEKRRDQFWSRRSHTRLLRMNELVV